MVFKMKLLIIAALLLLGVTGVAFASGQVPDAVSGGIATLTGSGVGGTSAASSAYEMTTPRTTSTEATTTRPLYEYGDDDATEQEDHGQARDDDEDEAGEAGEHHQGNMGRGAEHANEHANVPATTPVSGGNAPAHEADDEDDYSAQGGMGGYSGSDSSTSGTAGSHASSTKSHGRD
ncbi:MAG: hypothetical protein JJD96_05675 [Thermoleophilia bacterium]|nr:hypothetical protein [Thermoleophilia bacterium]